jgi:hypothetical protein
MLDEVEFKKIQELYSAAFKATKEFRQQHNMPLDDLDIDARFEPVRKEYERLTGWKEQHQNAVMHHRIALYGPDCPKCKKPFRTPQARFCAACGYEKDGFTEPGA